VTIKSLECILFKSIHLHSIIMANDYNIKHDISFLVFNVLIPKWLLLLQKLHMTKNHSKTVISNAKNKKEDFICYYYLFWMHIELYDHILI